LLILIAGGGPSSIPDLLVVHILFSGFSSPSTNKTF